MTLIIDDKMLAGIKINEEEAKLDFALGLFIDYKATLGQAAKIANISQGQFMEELGKRKIPIHYDIEDLEEDINTIKSLNIK